MIRKVFVTELVKELMGPRDGALEVLDIANDPRNEYQVGMIYPSDALTERDPDADSDISSQATASDDDDDDQSATPIVLGNEKNFRKMPSSFGVSFMVSGELKKGDIELCVTWARYFKIESVSWRREPRIAIFKYDPDVPDQSDGLNEIKLTVRQVARRSGFNRIAIFASSSVRPENNERVKTDEILFQPEIRVLLKNQSCLVELGEAGFSSSDSEWRILKRQYAARPVYARGHLCGTYWKDIDPQKEAESEEKAPPFHWIDGSHFLSENQTLTPFFKPDIRTDFCPMYAARAPSFIWEDSLRPAPELSAKKLSELADEETLVKAIEPLLFHYKQWIDSLRTAADKSDPDDLEIINRHINAHKRMEKGLAFLKSDKKAFMAFSFMNRAMYLQSTWGKRELEWRPFQLAFILLTAMSSVVSDDPDRNIADVLWFPTGGGKTEAYLGLAVFTCAYMKLCSSPDSEGYPTGFGTAVISRYTLRLLTIQQFRRALKVIMACELLRVWPSGGKKGWAPANIQKNWIWGTRPFSIGLWVGGNVTPNKMTGEGFKNIPPGAIALLKKHQTGNDESDPAQVLNCPCCSSILAIPVSGLQPGRHVLWLFAYDKVEDKEDLRGSVSNADISVMSVKSIKHPFGKFFHVGFELVIARKCSPNDIQKWWRDSVKRALPHLRLVSFDMPVRPGYIPIQKNRNQFHDYEIRCPNPDCVTSRTDFSEKVPAPNGTYAWKPQHPLFSENDNAVLSSGVPIPAITVDEKIYSLPPTMVIATVDKIATVPSLSDSSAASLFGRVKSYSPDSGYSQTMSGRGSFNVSNLQSPFLVIQDELHLLDGPLGSMFGMYETVFDYLSSKPKYIASSATIRNAKDQISSLISRRSSIFPPISKDIDNGFFLKIEEIHPLDESVPGRLFLGIAAPGRAAQTPIIRIWSRLIQTAQKLKLSGISDDALDPYWTLVGYFNAIRELAGAETYWRQDIPQRIAHIALASEKRNIAAMEGFKNLSSQTSSGELPGILASLERGLSDGDALDAVGATSMFGTGVDVDRLSLMVVHGQPKTASSYIQAVGRIGRKSAGLAVIFLRVSKPRDLNHYEYFTGYHRHLPVSVEPISVKPMAPRAIERVLGPLIVMLLRNGRSSGDLTLPAQLSADDGAGAISVISEDVISIIEKIFREKWENQPNSRRPPDVDDFIFQVHGAIEAWKNLADRVQGNPDPLLYKGKHQAVLGDVGNSGGDFAFQHAPSSLREVEPLIRLKSQ